DHRHPPKDQNLSHPTYGFSSQNRLLSPSDRQQGAGDLEIYHQGNGVHNGGNKGRGHDGRVSMTELGHHGHHAAHDLDQQHCYQQHQCHSQSNHFIAGVSDDQTHKIHRAEDYAHQEADTQFLPEHFYKVPQLNFSHSHAANHQGTALAAGIAA